MRAATWTRTYRCRRPARPACGSGSPRSPVMRLHLASALAHQRVGQDWQCVPRSTMPAMDRGSASRACCAAFSTIQSSSFNLVVLVEGRLACGEQHFCLQYQRVNTARTLWDGAPVARGLQTTTSGRQTSLWMTVQLFEKCPQGCHGRGATLVAPLQRLSQQANAVAGSPRCPWCGRRRCCAPHAAASRGRGPAEAC